VTFTGLDLVKMTIVGDFDNDFNYGSNQLKNLECLKSLTTSLKGNKKAWEYKTTEKKLANSWELDPSEQKRRTLSSTPLATIAYNRVDRSLRAQGAEGLKTCKQVADELRGYEGFHDERSKQKNEKSYLQKALEEAETEAAKKGVLTQIKKMTQYVKNKQYSKVDSFPANPGEPYLSVGMLRDIGARQLVFGDSGDSLFEKTLKETVGFTDLLKESTKNECSMDI
jgi:hypothetical protein